MKCPVCLASDSKVTDSRVSQEGFVIRRRRECTRCGYRFSTYEEVEILNLSVLKRDGRQEPYSREKLERGIRASLEKRPATQEDVKKLIHLIERDVQHLQKDEITSRTIGEIVMKRLKRFDTVAYIRFASVYRAFQDVSMFQREIAGLMPVRQRKTKRPVRRRAAKKRHS